MNLRILIVRSGNLFIKINPINDLGGQIPKSQYFSRLSKIWNSQSRSQEINLWCIPWCIRGISVFNSYSSVRMACATRKSVSMRGQVWLIAGGAPHGTRFSVPTVSNQRPGFLLYRKYFPKPCFFSHASFPKCFGYEFLRTLVAYHEFGGKPRLWLGRTWAHVSTNCLASPYGSWVRKLMWSSSFRSFKQSVIGGLRQRWEQVDQYKGTRR